MSKYSFIGDLVQGGSKAAKEVIEGAGGSANQRAKMIKNCVNNVKSNIGSGQAKAISEIGEDSGRALKEGMQNAFNQTKANTAERALNRTPRQSNAAVQKSKEFIDNKRVSQVIDGHNARSKQTAMDTMVNNVKDRSIDRVPKDHETTRRTMSQASENVRNARVASEPEVNPMHTPKSVTYSYQNKANVAKEEIAMTTENINDQSEPISNKAKEKINKAFDKGFEGIPNSIKDTFVGGIMDTHKNVTEGGQGIFEAIGNAHKNDDGSINWRRAAGTFMTTSAVARVASGGGLYKDRYGNPNLIGVPFI